MRNEKARTACKAISSFHFVSLFAIGLDNAVACIHYHYAHFIPPISCRLHLYTSRVYIRKHSKNITLYRNAGQKWFLCVEGAFLGTAS
jgi:hypothetical protein